MMTLPSRIADFLESEGFGNAAKFLRKYYSKKQVKSDLDPQVMDLLRADDISLSAKIMVITDSIVPNAPEPKMSEGLPDGMENNLQEIAYAQWRANRLTRQKMQQIAMELDA
jgi:hypothetical protein